MGTESWIGGGDDNSIMDSDGLIVGGEFNSETGPESVIGAGKNNLINNSEDFLGSGEKNTVSGSYTVLGAGYQNVASGNYAFLGSGEQNVLSADYSTIDGGVQNKVNGTAGYITIGGGLGNQAAGRYAVVPGGYRNEANGELSYAAGYHAEALNAGSFVWSDYTSSSSPLSDSAANEFIVRSSGGVTFYSNEGDTAGVSLAPGAGMWESLSDRNSKTDVGDVNDASVLSKIAVLPVRSWRYKSEAGVRHVGPMAQDFYAAFGVGEDDRHLNSIDEDGIAFSAIKALHRENAELRASVAADHAEIAEQRGELLQLKRDMQRVEEKRR